jgi:hypothetical protein
VEQRRRLDVQILVDESASLGKTDPVDKRVKALASVVDVLINVVQVTQDNSTPLTVNVMIAGFGSTYEVRSPFVELNESTSGRLREVLSEQEGRDSARHTRYQVALKKAAEGFVSFTDSDPTAVAQKTCRMLLWFSDGKHDDDDNQKDDKEPGQIDKLICSRDGLADDLRRNGVFIVAVGLTPKSGNRADLDTMKRIARSEPQKCGEVPATGIFALADDADELVSTILRSLSVPGTPDEPVTVEPCTDGSVDCGQVSFIVDDYVNSFSLLAVRPTSDVSLEVSKDSAASRLVLAPPGRTEDVGPGLLTSTKVADNTALVSANSSNGSLAGLWTFTFRGKDARTSKGSVSFLGSADLTLTTAVGEDVTEVNRAKPETLYIGVSATPGTMAIQELDAQLILGTDVQPLEAVLTTDGRFEISEVSVKKALENGEFAKAAQVTLVVSPVGVVNGIRTLSGQPVEVDFAPKVIQLLVNKGEAFPTFLGLGEENLQFTGTSARPVTLRFRGAEQDDVTVKFVRFEENDADFDVLPDQECTVSKDDEDKCVIDIKPGRETFGSKTLTLVVAYESAGGEKSDEVAIEIPVETKKSTNAGRGLLAALALVAGFLAVQGLVRWVLALLVTNFAALSPIARRVRIPVSVDVSGGVMLMPPPGGLDSSDEGFAFENQDKCRQFAVFGLDFTCSVLTTFRSQTDSPVGRVASTLNHCFSSGGAMRDAESGWMSGVIALSLRGQWVLALPDDAVRQAAFDGTPAEGFLVAFLDPYESRDRDQQLNDIEVAVATGSFPGAFMELVETYRTQEANEAPDDGEDPPFGDSSWDPSDPFGGPPPSAPVATTSRRGRRASKDEATDATSAIADDSDPFGSSDPFR